MPLSFSLEKEGLNLLHPNSWIIRYLHYVEGQESPTKFHVWSAISAIASALNRKVWMYRGYYMLYPNCYIIIVAESARCRKSTSADIAIDDILESTGSTEILRQKMTAEFLCKVLSSKDKQNNDICIYASELATFLGASAFTTGIIPLLTGLYSCPSKSDYKTKGEGEHHLTNVCINMLGCTTLDWMSSNMPGDSIEGGFTGRVIFVVQEDPRLSEPWPSLSEEQVRIRTELINDLTRITHIRGEYKPDEGAKAEYAKEYNKIKEPPDPRLRGYYGRKGDHLLKIAMILAASEGNSMTLNAKHIKTSAILLKKNEELMHMAYRGAAFNEGAKDVDRVLRMIEKEGGQIPHWVLAKKNNAYLKAKEFREVIQTLLESNDIREHKEGNKIIYLLKGKKYNKEL